MGCILAEMLSIASKMCEDYQSKGFSARASAAGFLVWDLSPAGSVLTAFEVLEATLTSDTVSADFSSTRKKKKKKLSSA